MQGYVMNLYRTNSNFRPAKNVVGMIASVNIRENDTLPDIARHFWLRL